MSIFVLKVFCSMFKSNLLFIANAILEKHEDRVIGPIKIQPGAKLSFKVTIKVAEDIPADVELALLLKKKMGWFWPSIPCIKQLGSW